MTMTRNRALGWLAWIATVLTSYFTGLITGLVTLANAWVITHGGNVFHHDVQLYIMFSVGLVICLLSSLLGQVFVALWGEST
jgi:hypothetical protein